MIYEERPGPPGLEAAISRIWYLDAARERPYEKILPQPAMHLIVNLSEPYVLFDRSGAATRVGDAFVSGIQSEYLVIASPAVIRQVVVEVRPGGLGAISTLPGTDVAGRVRAADEVVVDAAILVGEVRSAATPGQALDRLRDALARIGAGWRADPVVETALTGIRAEHRIGGIVGEVGVSHRTLIARFRRTTGLTPRDFAQLLRFHRFVTSLDSMTRPHDWAGLAPLGGYYDQAHVVRAFRRYSGWTPTEYRRRVAEFGPSAATFVPLDELPAGS